MLKSCCSAWTRKRAELGKPSPCESARGMLGPDDVCEAHFAHVSKERRVVFAHFGLGQRAQTLDEIGGTLGLSGERARQIEAGALDKLRAALA